MQNHQRSPIFDFNSNSSSNFHQYRYSNILNDAVVVGANTSSMSEEEDPVPSFEEFQGIINDYLQNLSPKKRDKALVDHARYCLIQEVLKNPRNTSISTAQFRFWVKKMFQLQPGSYDLVCHDNKPVAMREQIYDILVNAHKEAHHGGRDKTSAIVRNQFSWIPKELVARFVRQCPTCISRRNGSQSLSAYTSKTSSPRIDYSTPSSTFTYDMAAVAAAAAAAAAASAAASATTPTLLYTPSSKAESDISASPSTDNTFRRSPNNNNYNIISPSPSAKRPFFSQDGLYDITSGDHYALDYPIHTSPTTGNRSPYYRRRSSAHMPQLTPPSQPEFVSYTTFTANTPSYYKTLISSYQRQTVLESSASTNTGSSSDFTSAATAVAVTTQSPTSDALYAMERSSSILSHNTDASSSL